MSAAAVRTRLMLLVLAAAMLPNAAAAALRSPQVPVLGNVLQDVLNSMFQMIDVRTQKDATQSWSPRKGASSGA